MVEKRKEENRMKAPIMLRSSGSLQSGEIPLTNAQGGKRT